VVGHGKAQIDQNKNLRARFGQFEVVGGWLEPKLTTMSAQVLILVNFEEVGVGWGPNWPKRALAHLIWPTSKWWGIKKLELTKTRTCVLNLANSRWWGVG